MTEGTAARLHDVIAAGEARLEELRELHAEAVVLEERIAAVLNGGTHPFTRGRPALGPAVDERTIDEATIYSAGDGVPPPADAEARLPRRPGAERPQVTATRADPTQAAAEERANDLYELLRRVGDATEADLKNTTGWGASALRTALRKLKSSKRAMPTGEFRKGPLGGRASRVWAAVRPQAEAADTPEPEAPASTDDDAGADELLPAAADDLTATEPRRQTVETHYKDPDNRRGPEPIPDHLQGDVDRIVQLCRDERRTVAELAELLDYDKRAMTNLVKRLTPRGIIEAYGFREQGTGEVTTYRTPPSMEERGVTVRQAPPIEGSLQGQVVNALTVYGRQRIDQLAARVVKHPRLVAEAVEELLNDDPPMVERTGGGMYELVTM